MIKVKTLAPNQIVLTNKDVEVFYSYDTPICKKENGKVTCYPAWNYSKTTSKYRSQFLGELTKETKAKLANGTYTMGDAHGD